MYLPLYSYLPVKVDQFPAHAVSVGSHVVFAILLARQLAAAPVQTEELSLMEGELSALLDRLCLVAADALHDGLHVRRLGGGRGGKNGETRDQLHFLLHWIDTPYPGTGMHKGTWRRIGAATGRERFPAAARDIPGASGVE